MHKFIKSAVMFCFFVAAAMLVAAPATAQTQKKGDAKEVKKEKTASCCSDKKSADAKECSDKGSDKDCCADGKAGKHTTEQHEKMMKEKEGEKKDDGKKDDGK